MLPARGAPRPRYVLPLLLASVLGIACLAGAVSAPPASAYAAGTWTGTIGIEWDAQNELGHEQFDGQITITGSGDPQSAADPEPSPYSELYGPFSATWSHHFYGDPYNTEYPPCTATGPVMSPEFVPYSGTSDQSLSMEWDLTPYVPDDYDPYKGTYQLNGPYVMIAASGCEQYNQAYNGLGYQWNLQAHNLGEGQNLNLTLPTQGERGPRTEAGGKLHWTGQQSLSNTPEDPSTGDTAWTVVWTYDLTWTPDVVEPCRLTAAVPQKLANALKVQVLGGKKGCYVKVESIKYKVGNRVFSYIGKKPQRRVAAGEVWRLSYPIRGTFKTIVARALRANKTVLGKLTATLDGVSNDVVVRIR